MKPHEHILSALDLWIKETHGSYIYEQVSANDVKQAYLHWKQKAEEQYRTVTNKVDPPTPLVIAPPTPGVSTTPMPSRRQRRDRNDITWEHTGDVE